MRAPTSAAPSAGSLPKETNAAPECTPATHPCVPNGWAPPSASRTRGRTAPATRWGRVASGSTATCSPPSDGHRGPSRTATRRRRHWTARFRRRAAPGGPSPRPRGRRPCRSAPGAPLRSAATAGDIRLEQALADRCRQLRTMHGRCQTEDVPVGARLQCRDHAKTVVPTPHSPVGRSISCHSMYTPCMVNASLAPRPDTIVATRPGQRESVDPHAYPDADRRSSARPRPAARRPRRTRTRP